MVTGQYFQTSHYCGLGKSYIERRASGAASDVYVASTTIIKTTYEYRWEHVATNPKEQQMQPSRLFFCCVSSTAANIYFWI
jgi:hypothetical protein